MNDVTDADAVKTEIPEHPEQSDPLIGYRLTKHAYRDYVVTEFKAAGLMDADGGYQTDEQKIISEVIIKIADALDGGDRSEQAAGYIMQIMSRISTFAPLSDIMGTDDEWRDIEGSPHIVKQNTRLPNLVTLTDGPVAYANAIAFISNAGESYTGIAQTKAGDIVSSAQIIKGYPFAPLTCQVNVEFMEIGEDGEMMLSESNNDKSILVITDESELGKVAEYYDYKTMGNINNSSEE